MAASYWDREGSYRKRIVVLTPVVLALIAAVFFFSGRMPRSDMTHYVGLRGPMELLPEITIEPEEPSRQAAPKPAGETAPPAVKLELRDQGETEASLPLPEPNPPRPLTEVPAQDEMESRESPSRPQASYSDTYVILHMVKPKYPPHERDQGLEGNVTVELLVDEHGNVAQARVVSLLGPVSFQESALEAVRQFLFQPPVENGRPSSMWIKFLIKFRIIA